MLAELEERELVVRADALVDDILAAAGVRQPPVDTLALAAAIGFTVTRNDGEPGRARMLRPARAGGNARSIIVVGCEPRPERRQWAVAHELGEHLTALLYRPLGESPSGHQREQAANLLANRLLLPTSWFAADGRDCHWDLAELKHRYPTASHELIARRMLDQPDPCVITIIDQQSIYLRRSNRCGRVPPMSRRERDCWLQTHGSGVAAVSDDGRGRVLVRGWPVHEPPWKREILRTELSDCDG